MDNVAKHVDQTPEPSRPPPAPPLFSRAAVVASCVGFILIGALQALYGPSIPAFREIAKEASNGVLYATLVGALQDEIGTFTVSNRLISQP